MTQYFLFVTDIHVAYSGLQKLILLYFLFSWSPKAYRWETNSHPNLSKSDSWEKRLFLMDGITPIKLSISSASEFDNNFVEDKFDICCPETSQKSPEVREIMSFILSFVNELQLVSVWLSEWECAPESKFTDTRFPMTNYPVFSIVNWYCTSWDITVKLNEVIMCHADGRRRLTLQRVTG